MSKPIVSIIMGSDSDLPVMKDAAEILEQFNVPYECTVMSAHRSPEKVAQFAKEAEGRGIQVIIAGAGGAAHLAGVVASLTTLPVIGVPIKSKALNGVDSLYSIVQMPPGIPVATVGIDGAKNAGILAASIVALNNEELRNTLKAYKQEMDEKVGEKAKRLEEMGYKAYLAKMSK